MGAGLPERQHLPFRTRVHHLTQWEEESLRKKSGREPASGERRFSGRI